MHQFGHTFSVVHRPESFVLVSHSCLLPSTSRTERLRKSLEAPAHIIKTSFADAKFVRLYPYWLEFAIQAFLQADDFCKRSQLDVPIVCETLQIIRSGVTRGLEIRGDAMAELFRINGENSQTRVFS